MEVLCVSLLIGKLLYDGVKYLHAQWYAQNRNPYRMYRQQMTRRR